MFPKEVLDKQTSILQYFWDLNISTNQIQNKNLMLQAFIHKSFAADYKQLLAHNERLEFLWDWVLSAITNKLLYIHFPEYSESDLTLYKIALVREETLAEVAKDINLDKHIFVSKWEERVHWRTKNSILSDCLEALLWFIYLEIGEKETEKFIQSYIFSKISSIQKDPIKSYKTMVQEYLQKIHKELPVYQDFEYKVDEKWTVETYKSELYLQNQKLSEWFGSSKKKAQEDSAKNYFLTTPPWKEIQNP